MKAIVQDIYGSSADLNLREIATPEVGDDEALVRGHAAGADRDVWRLTTGLPYLTRLAFGFCAPKPRPGVDVAGVVKAVGKDVSRSRPAMRYPASARARTPSTFALARTSSRPSR